MLDTPKEIVSRRQFVAGGGIDPTAGGKLGKRRHGAATAQLRMPAAGDELLGLDEKLDLADAAASKLDIVTFHGDFAMAAIGVNLLLHGVNVGDCRVVEVLAPDERRELADEPLAGGNVAGARPRLDQSRALPVLAAALVIIERGFRRDGDLGRRRVGTKPQIDAEYIAVGGALLQKLHQLARHAHVER